MPDLRPTSVAKQSKQAKVLLARMIIGWDSVWYIDMSTGWPAKTYRQPTGGRG